MSEERKAKAEARRAARAAKKIQSSQNEPVEPITTQIDIEPLNTEIDVKSTIAKPQDIAASSLRLQDAPEIAPAKAFVQNAKGVQTLEPAADNNLSHVSTIQPQKAVSVNPTESPIQPKVITISDMLEGQRKKITQDKTDAAKMQRYYALTDALKALGQMGGAAIGGAIGGNALDSAPKVAEYKESRGYLDAIENAKKANDRLRALDEKEFNLTYNKQQRDEDRAYREKIAEEDRKFRAEQAELDRKMRTANEKERAKLEMEKLSSRQAHEKWLKEQSLEYARIMMRGKGGSGADATRTGIPFIFDDDSVAYIDKEDITALKNRYINRKIGDMTIDEDNFYEFLAKDPSILKNYRKRIGKNTEFLTLEPETPQEDEAPETVEEMPKKSFWKAFNDAVLTYDTPNVISVEPDAEVVKKDAQYYINKYGKK